MSDTQHTHEYNFVKAFSLGFHGQINKSAACVWLATEPKPMILSSSSSMHTSQGEYWKGT